MINFSDDSSMVVFGSPGKKEYGTVQFLFILTIIQFWWIAIWGIAYIVIDIIAGPSRMIEVGLYIGMLVLTAALIHMNPTLLDHL